MQSILEFFVIYFLICVGINFTLKAPSYRGPLSDHFDGKRFCNITVGKRHIIEPKNNRLMGMFVFMVKKFDSKVWHKRELPSGEAHPPERVFGKEISVTFIGHATVLLQTEGLNIITDPVWSLYASPWQFLGPKRYMPPGMKIENLPKIDFILLSHNHYDHMDIVALRKLCCRDHLTIYTTLGNSRYLRDRGIGCSLDMDWGQSRKFSESISVECVPAQHFSARAITDRNKTLWGGFVIRTPHGNIYFAGDTAYGPCIGRVKKMYPDGFRLAFLPIGAFEPRMFMKEVHASPVEAVQIHKELKISHSIPIHFGTFDLALDGQDDPVSVLKQSLSQEVNSDVQFTVLHNGETCAVE